MTSKKEKTIDLSLLDAKELRSLRDQLDAEVQSLSQSAVALQRAAGEFGKSGRSIETLAEQDEGVLFHNSYDLLLVWGPHYQSIE